MDSFQQTVYQMDQLVDFLEEDLSNIQRVIDFVRSEDIEARFEVHAKAETCEESAEHSPVSMEQIVKTLVFIGEEPVAVLAPGSARVDEDQLESQIGEEVRMADPDEVRGHTGYPIGAVSPFDLDIRVLMEESLLEHDEVRPAAGSRAVGAVISPGELADLDYIEKAQVT